MGVGFANGEASAVRDAVAALARSLKRVSVDRRAPGQHPGHLEQTLLELRRVLEAQQAFTVALLPTGVLYEGEIVHSESAREHNFCYRLHRDGVRTLTFKRGVSADELLAFARLATGNSEAGEREDAVTELWKAELPHIGYGATSGYRLDGKGVSAAIAEIAARVQSGFDKHLGERFVETGQQSLLWNEAQRIAADPRDWPRLAGRAALTVLRIVSEDYAGWDIDALKETLARLADRMLEQEAAQPLAQALLALKTVPGPQGADFRVWMSRWLADPARLGFALELGGGTRLLPAWLALLAPETGLMLLSLLPRARDAASREALGQAILSRLDSCGMQVAEVLRGASAAEARPLLAGLSTLAPMKRNELATAAFQNPDPSVALEAIPHLAQDPAAAARTLGPALQHRAREVRLACAQALAAIPNAGDRAGKYFIEALAGPAFAEADEEEMAVFHRALGKLGSTVGFMYLSSQLALPRKKLFGRKKRIQQQLFAVEGLAEEGSPRSLRALDDGSSVKRGYARPVAEACQAAALRVRTRKLS